MPSQLRGWASKLVRVARMRSRTQGRPAAEDERRADADHERRHGRQAQPPHDVRKIGGFPMRERTHRHQHQRRHHQRHEHRVEIRRTDRQLAQSERIDKQWIERAEKHRSRGHPQQDVVDQ
jgi:hypothetical protein